MKITRKFRLFPSLFLSLTLVGGTLQDGRAADYTTFMENTTAQSQITDLSMYRLVFSKENIPVYGNKNVGSAAWYDYADTASFASGWNGAIFYFQTTTNAGKNEWMLVDAPNYSGTNMYQLGICRYGNASDVVNRVITGSNVYTHYESANMPLFAGVTPDGSGVSTLTNANVILEFWPYNYSGNAQTSKPDQNGNAFTLSTANTTGYDWNDTPAADGDHGSWQIHLYDAASGKGQTLIGLSRLYREKDSSNIVIGNSSSGSALDGTMVTNTVTNNGRSLQVLAIPNYASTDRIFNASAGGTEWNIASDWYDSAASVAGTAPTAGNDVFVNTGSVTVSGNSAGNTLNAAHTGSVTVNAGASLTLSGTTLVGGADPAVNTVDGAFHSAGTVKLAASLNVGSYGTNGILDLTGGTLTGTNVYVAQGANASASYRINNTALNATGTLVLGNGANSSAEGQISNSVITTPFFSVAQNTGSSASLVLSDSTVYSGTTSLGVSGNAAVTINNGKFFSANGVPDSRMTDFFISQNASSTSTVDLRGAGTKIVTTNFNVGYRGNGTLNMYDGEILCSSYYCIGNNISDAFGTVNQYGGSVSTPWAPLGHNGKGVYNMFGGTFTVTGAGAQDSEGATGGSLSVGDRVGSSVTFNQSGGTVTSKGFLYVGRVGSGVYNLTGGDLIAEKGVSIGHLKNTGNPGSGTFTMDGGKLLSKGGINVGNNSTGSFVQNGGTVDIGGNTLRIGQNAGSVGSYTMNGGNIISGTIGVGCYGAGTFDFKGGNIKNSGWFLVGFNAGKGFTTPNTANQYAGASLDTGWFTLGWDGTDSDGTYNMYGGTLTANGNGNPVIIAKTGTGVFNLYDGTVTMKAATSTNQGQTADYVGYALKLGYTGTGKVNVYAGDITATGNVSIGATSTLHFEPTLQGIGSLKITGNLNQAAGGVISVSGTNSVAFLDGYSTANGVDIMTVSGKNALSVTNSDPAHITASYSADTGVLNLKMNADGFRGTLNAASDSITFAPSESGWVSLENFGGNDPYEIGMKISTENMARDAFINVLNSEMKVGEETLLTATAGLNDDEVVLHFMPSLVDADVFMWNFSDAALYNGGVALVGLNIGAVPEPASWILLAAGLCALAGFRRRKRA